MILHKPDGYNAEEAKALLETTSGTKAEDGDKPNIIVILNESFADLKTV